MNKTITTETANLMMDIAAFTCINAITVMEKLGVPQIQIRTLTSTVEQAVRAIFIEFCEIEGITKVITKEENDLSKIE